MAKAASAVATVAFGAVLVASRAAGGAVGVDVRMRARAQFKVAGVRSRHYGLEAFCSPVVVGLSPSAARSFQSVPCDVAIS